MIQILIGKMIGKAVIKKVFAAIEKADDKRIASKHDREIKELKKEVKILKKNSHPRADWVCMDCGCNAKKVVKSTRRK